MPRSFVIRGASVLDENGAFTDPQDIAVDDGVVSAVGASLPTRDAAVYDLDGLWVMPGVFDCHMHVAFSTVDQMEVLRTPPTQLLFESARNARVTLEAGVTFVRDAGGADAGIRNALDRGYVPGPRVQISVSMLSQTGGHGDGFLQGLGASGSLAPRFPGKPEAVVDGVDGMRLRVRELLRAGADWIKLCSTGGILSPHDLADEPQFVPEELEVAVLEARRRKVPVMAHAFGGVGLSDAVTAGVRSIEHGLYLTEEQAAQMARSGCYLVPTLSQCHDVVAWADQGLLPPYSTAKAYEDLKPVIGDAVKVAHAAGVKIAMGTDFVSRQQHGRNLEELYYMHAAGLTAEETLRSATSVSAQLCGVGERFGRFAPGFVFDAVVLKRDPSDMKIFRDRDSVAAVFKGSSIARGEDVLRARLL
jgi:imidazolonepropionase-like amidohydrolase